MSVSVVLGRSQIAELSQAHHQISKKVERDLI